MFSTNIIFKNKSFTLSALIHFFLITLIIIGFKNRNITIERSKAISVELSFLQEKEMDIDEYNQKSQLDENDNLVYPPQLKENLIQKEPTLKRIPEPKIEETEKLNEKILNDKEKKKSSNKNHLSNEQVEDTYKKEFDKGALEDFQKNKIEKFSNSVHDGKPIRKSIEVESLNSYKNYLKKKIQLEATKNYPRASFRKREEGNVEIIFSLTTEGDIKDIKVGLNTTASKRITDSLIRVMRNKIGKFKKDKILKKINTFSLIIVYKLE